jgi:hypothetical protein
MTKGWKIGLGLFAALLVSLYLGLWIYSAQWFAKEIDKLYAQGTESDIQFLGPKPSLTNFPFVPEVLYTQGFKTGNAEILFPEMSLRGYPIFGTALNVDFPKGISVGGIVDPSIWTLDSLRAKITIPYNLPHDLSAESLIAWRDSGGKIEIRSYDMHKKSLQSDGKGHLFLDAELQPDLLFESTVRGYQAFIQEQKEAGLIEPFAAAIGLTILNGLATTDKQTGESVVRITVTVKNRILSAGPVQALELPLIVWDTHSPPVPHQ